MNLTGFFFFNKTFHECNIILCKTFDDEHHRKINDDGNRDDDKDVYIVEKIHK